MSRTLLASIALAWPRPLFDDRHCGRLGRSCHDDGDDG